MDISPTVRVQHKVISSFTCCFATCQNKEEEEEEEEEATKPRRRSHQEEEEEEEEEEERCLNKPACKVLRRSKQQQPFRLLDAAVSSLAAV